MISRIPRHVYLLGCLLGVFAAHDLHASWPATDFQVVTREPVPEEILRSPADQGVLDKLLQWRPESGTPDPDTPTPNTRTMERWFRDIGDRYRQVGHLPPPLAPIVRTDGADKYRVYVFPYTGSRTRNGSSAGGSYETNTCMNNNKVPWLSINHDLTLAPPLRSHYWTIGHELMHALMFGDRILRPCNRNPFEVSEGIPDAAGLFLINQKYPNYSGHLDSSNSSVGLRSYRMPFLTFKDVPESHKSRLEIITGYGTSSFWRFLAERFGGLQVLRHFLHREIPPGAQHKDVYQWLEERLQKLPGLAQTVSPAAERVEKQPPGFYEVYPAFVTEFASYGGARYKSFDWRRFSTWDQARKRWLTKAFGGCQKITLSPENRNGETRIVLQPNGAKCFRVAYSGFKGNVRPSIEAMDGNLRTLDQLHLGWAWKIGPNETENCYTKGRQLGSKWPPCVYKAFTQTGPETGTYVRTWPLDTLDFGTQGNGFAEHIFVLSNVAVKPSATAMVPMLVLKVAVSDSTANGEPTEPIEKLTVPRKSQPRNPAKANGKEALYGLQTDPPLPDAGIKGFSLTPYTPNRSRGAKAKPGGYAIQINEMKYGGTGPVRGTVALQPDDPKAREGAVSSILCKDGHTPIGRVLQSDEKALRIEVDTDLCQASAGTLPQCKDGCPVVDHVTAEVNIAFGWRSFSDTAPTDIRTPGIERYINTMPGSLQEAMRFGAGTAIPNMSGIGSPGAPGGGSSSSKGGTLADCACSCEEREQNERGLSELKARIEAGDTAALSAMGEFTRCTVPCQRAYMLCVMEADRAAKAQKEQEAQAQRDAINCDCSCEALTARMQQARGLESAWMQGGGIPQEQIAELAHCATVCQPAMIQCAMQR